MAIADKNGLIIESNPQFNELMEAISGFGNAQAPNFLSIHETLRFANFFSRLTSGATQKVKFEAPFHDSRGILHWFRIYAWVIPPRNDAEPRFQGPLIGFTMTDQTRERREGERLQEDKAVAERAMEAKNQFLANISHEIRTPIQTIIGMTELLQDTKLDREQTEYSRQVKFAADVLLSLINDILDFSKIEAGKLELEYTRFDLDQAIEQAVEMITLEAHKKGLEIALDIAPELNITVLGDPHKFRQIVINLVKNAVKFTQEGSVTISARLTDLEGLEAVTVAVADTGIGIPEESRGRLFTTFFQADPSNTRCFGGTGLGLAIARNLVELMGGTIEMVPREGGGSIFRFSIPIEQLKHAPEPVLIRQKTPDVRILLVDDREESRAIITSYLKDIGYQDTDAAASGEQALELLRAAVQEGKPYGLCLIDMIMPLMDGWRLAAEINRDASINEIRLILMVPHGLLGAEAKMTLLKWFNAYINKPIKRKDLTEIVAQTLSGPPVDLETAAEDQRLLHSEKAQAGEFSGDPARPEGSVPVHAADLPGKPDLPGKHGLPGKASLPLVLIAEDHPVNQKLFAIIMEKLGCAFILADDGLDALDKAETYPVDLIFMDIQMPRMNGYEAAQQLRERGFTRPIITVTASALQDEWAQCLKAGINDILLKPFKQSDIEGLLHKWMPPPGTAKSGDQDSGKHRGGQGLLARAARHSPPRPAADAGPLPSVPPAPPAEPGEPKTTPVLGAAPAPSPFPARAAGPVRVAAPEPPEILPVWVSPVRVSGAVPAAPVSISKDPVFDRRELLNAFLQDAETVKPLVGRFLERTEDQIDGLPAMIQQEAWEEARIITHTIKGSALTLSGRELGQAAARMELAFKNRDRDEIQAGLPPLKDAFVRFKGEAKMFIGETEVTVNA
jgi:signal transduction histidine kinase/DNA-binding response OmpR family regulator/HPt (histidine-containing phosphotransfer) domain-containing protein